MYSLCMVSYLKVRASCVPRLFSIFRSLWLMNCISLIIIFNLFLSVFNASATWKDVCQKYETSLKANFLKFSTFSTTFPCRRYCSSFDCYLNGGVFNMKKNRQTKIYSSTWEIHRNVCGLTKCRIFPSFWSTSSDSVFSKIFFPLRIRRFVLITPKNVFSLKWRAIVGMGRKCPISFILLLGNLYLFRWLNNPY